MSEKQPLIAANGTEKRPKPEKRKKRAETTQSDLDIEALIGLPKKGKRQESAFVTAFRNLKLLAPFLYPYKDPWLQINVVICMIILIAGRVVNLYVPIYNGYIVNSLTTNGTQPLEFRWDYILTYASFRAVQSTGFSGGLLNAIRLMLWVKVQQYTTREVQLRLFAHLHQLPLKWHLSRKTGEVLRVMDRGTASVNQLLNILLYQILPTIFDVIIGIVYFFSAFNYYFAIIVVITMAIYLGVTVGVTEYRTKFRRTMNAYDNAQRAKAVDSLLNFETVKYYNNEQFEYDRYEKSILNFQKSEYLTQISLALLNSVQSITISGGLLAGCMLCAYFVVGHQFGLTVGDYVLFTTYLQQLNQPLNFLGSFYSTIQQNVVDMENMCELLEVEPEIIDATNAPALRIKEGAIEFRDVSFHYLPEKPILQNVSFKIEPGKSLALVGPSGSGKSTVIRLLFRFYDVNSGNIFMDNQDISLVQQKSLRQVIGVVPQDTVLFNDTIRYNIRYGRVSASDRETEGAAEAADIHHRIVTFPEGYKTNVGERGLKLSGGEKQRVAIARTLLKAPAIVLLDEATSALDTQTERNIQASLNKVSSGRTTLVVAHRLSTVVDCDEIIVLVNGRILERGRHNDLLAENGMYARMWDEQATAMEMIDDLDQQPASGAGTGEIAAHLADRGQSVEEEIMLDEIGSVAGNDSSLDEAAAEKKE